VNKVNVYLFLNDVWRPVQIGLTSRQFKYELQLLSNESFVAECEGVIYLNASVLRAVDSRGDSRVDAQTT